MTWTKTEFKKKKKKKKNREGVGVKDSRRRIKVLNHPNF